MNLCSLDLWPLCYLINRIIIIHILSLPERALKITRKNTRETKGKVENKNKCLNADRLTLNYENGP